MKKLTEEQKPSTFSKSDILVEFLAIAGLVMLWAETYHFQHLGAELVSKDYTFLESPNEFWASQMTYSIPFIATLIYIGLTIYNKKRKHNEYEYEFDKEKSAAVLRINQRLWRWLKLNLILVLLIIEYFSFHTGSSAGDGISIWFILIFPVLIFGPVVYFFVAYSREQLQ
jgi:hypothetical protein